MGHLSRNPELKEQFAVALEPAIAEYLRQEAAIADVTPSEVVSYALAVVAHLRSTVADAEAGVLVELAADAGSALAIQAMTIPREVTLHPDPQDVELPTYEFRLDQPPDRPPHLRLLR